MKLVRESSYVLLHHRVSCNLFIHHIWTLGTLFVGRCKGPKGYVLKRKTNFEARNVLRTSWAGQWFTTSRTKSATRLGTVADVHGVLKKNGLDLPVLLRSPLCCWGSVGGSKCPSCQSPRNDHQASARPENGRCSRRDLATAAAACHS